MKVTLEILEGPDYAQDEDGWEHNAYKVRLSYQGRSMKVPWRAGLGITGDPTAADVLDSLLMDAAGFENARGFEDWAAEYGFDTDSRRATGEDYAVQIRALDADEYGPCDFRYSCDGDTWHKKASDARRAA